MDKNVETETLILNIDIGGVALLRAAAKNYENVIVISDKKDYSIDLDEIDEDKKLIVRFLSKKQYVEYLLTGEVK